MIVKFFKSNKQPIQNAFAYFLNERVESNTARLLSGSLGLAEMLAENQRSSVKYFSGCLSFKEPPEHFSEQDKYEIMDEFMQAIMPNQEIRERINWTWIEHTDKGRLELNFVVNTRFLESIGKIKQYNFFCKHHLQTIDAFQDWVDAKYGCESWKNAPANVYRHHLNTRQSKTFNHEMLQYMIENIILENPDLETRDDLVKYLEQVGFHVSREVRGSISILPDNSSKPIRLTITKDVSLDEYRQKLIDSMKHQAVDVAKSQHIQSLKDRLEMCKQTTSAYTQQRYFKHSEHIVKTNASCHLTYSTKQSKPMRVYTKFEKHENQQEEPITLFKIQEKHIKSCFSSSYHPIMNHDMPIDELSEEEYAKYIMRVQKWLIDEAAKAFGWIGYIQSWAQSIEQQSVQHINLNVREMMDTVEMNSPQLGLGSMK